MRNVPFTSNVGGSELIGVVKSGKKFPFGTVSEETYNADLADITERIQNVGEVAEHAVNSIAEVSTTVDSQGVRITTAEHAIATQSQTIAELTSNMGGITARLTSAESGLQSVTTQANTTQAGLALQVTKEAADYAELTGKVNVITEAVENFSVVTHGIEEDVASNEHRLDAVEASISVLTTKEASDVAAIETAIENVNAGLNARISTVDTSLTASINTNINAVNAAITETHADIAELSSRHTADNNALNARIDTTNSTIAIVRADIATLNGNMEALSNSVDSRISDINRRIDSITGDETVTIESFTATPNVCELGGTENVILTWTTTGNVYSTKINGITVTGNTYTATVTTDTRFTLEVAPAHGAIAAKSIDVKFVNHIFWGASASPEMDEGAVKALDFTELSDKRTREFVVESNRQYIYYAYPARLGASVFFADGFEGGMLEPSLVAIDNHSGVTENYYVYRSENKVSGVTQVEVR